MMECVAAVHKLNRRSRFTYFFHYFFRKGYPPIFAPESWQSGRLRQS